MRTIDISMAIRDAMPGFPGDPAVRVDRVKSRQRGDAYDVSALAMSSHTGTHVDPPFHFIEGGRTIDEVELGALNGPCEVVHVEPEFDVVGRAEASRIAPGSVRVLFRTRNSDRPESPFHPDYVALNKAAADTLVERGVRLVGIDALSVESDSTGTFPVHHALLGAGCLILEGLRLAEASAGRAVLRCLPLRVHRGDGGPARAVLDLP